MPHVYADRVKETTESTGTGALVLAGAPSGFRAFSPALSVDDTADICIEDPATGAWEVTRATLTAPALLSRGTLLASSTGTRVSFGAGQKWVYLVVPAAEIMRRTEVQAALDLKANAAAVTAALADKLDAAAVSAFGASLIDDADATAARATLDLDDMAQVADAPNDGGLYARRANAWEAVPERATIVAVTADSHVPGVGIDGRYFVCSHADGCAVTVPANADEAHPVGTMLTYEQADDDAVTFTPGSGVTLLVPASRAAETAEQYAVVQLVKRATNTWVIYGNLAAA